MNLTITPMTSMARNNRIAFKSEMGGDPEGPRRRSDIGVSGSIKDASEGDNISISRADLDQFQKHAQGRETFSIALGVFIGAVLGTGIHASLETMDMKKIVTQLDQKYGDGSVTIKGGEIKDINKDGNNDIVLNNSDSTQTIMDFYSGVLYHQRPKDIVDCKFTDGNGDGIPEVTLTTRDSSQVELDFLNSNVSDKTTKEAD